MAGILAFGSTEQSGVPFLWVQGAEESPTLLMGSGSRGEPHATQLALRTCLSLRPPLTLVDR